MNYLSLENMFKGKTYWIASSVYGFNRTPCISTCITCRKSKFFIYLGHDKRSLHTGNLYLDTTCLVCETGTGFCFCYSKDILIAAEPKIVRV